MDQATDGKAWEKNEPKENAKEELSKEAFGGLFKQTGVGGGQAGTEEFGLMRTPDEVRLGGTKIYYGEKDPGNEKDASKDATKESQSIYHGVKEILEDLDKDKVPQWLVKGGELLKGLDKEMPNLLMKGSGILEDLDKDTVPQWLVNPSKILEDLDKDTVPQWLVNPSKILEDLDKDTVPQFFKGGETVEKIVLPGPQREIEGEPKTPRFRPGKESRSLGIDRTPTL